jgi:hypothetical protein
MEMKRRLATGAMVVVLGLSAFAGNASANPLPNSDTLTVTLPCGCVLFNNAEGFPAGITGGLPVGAAPYTPAANNPSGKATFNP